MRIGIDIDGVLTDIERWQIDYASKYFYENYQKEISNYNGFNTIDIFDISEEQDIGFWKKYFKNYSVNVPPRLFANEIIDKLKKDGNEIYIITARGSFLSRSSETMTKEENESAVLIWLEQHHIYYDRIIFTPEDKLKICLENNVNLMIEDKPQNIEEISSKLPVVIMNANYNQDINNENTIRCYSWYDIYAKISKIKKEN